MKKILGLDLGTNSIGWALIEQDFDKKAGQILRAGSRIIPMDQSTLSNFDKGNSISQTAERTGYRGVRRLRQRHLLRRERLHRVLNILSYLPEHYQKSVDFENKKGQFKDNFEVKLPYIKNEQGKYEFLFQQSFNEMLEDFRKHQPQLLAGNKKVPFDWTIFYLRKKALTQKISKQELAWLILNFNQKRGYYQLRGEDEDEQKGKLVEFHSLRVTDITDTQEKRGKDQALYKVILENGWEFIKPSRKPIDWKGKLKDFIVTTEVEEDGIVKLNKYGEEKRTFRAPNEDDWTLIKKKTERDIDNSTKTVGCYIYDKLLQKPNQKIKGKLIRTIERHFYKNEIAAILERQKDFHQELSDKGLYQKCVEELYQKNIAHQNNILSRDINYLLIEDIIFYQRPLKSKKSLIDGCRYETRSFIKNGELIKEKVKCIPKSHPLFQEYRLWQFVKNLKICEREKYEDGKLNTDVDVTQEYFRTQEDCCDLFDWLNQRKEVKQEALLKKYKLNKDKYRWNYVEDKIYPCNETRTQFVTRLSKIKDLDVDSFLTKENELSLWHLLYSISDKKELEKALATFARKHQPGDELVQIFSKFPPYDNSYGAYSAKAIKKLLPFMRRGNYWNEKEVANSLGNVSHEIKQKVIDKENINGEIHDFQGLYVSSACYIVYGRFSEELEITKWDSPEAISNYLSNEFKQHSLRNPIVEQVVTETLRVVRDIWEHYGNGNKDFFDKIHIELGREMKNSAEKRKFLTQQVTENENTNLRVKALLRELKNEGNDTVRPFSPSQHEILKIYEEGVYSSGAEIPNDIEKIRKNPQPTNSEINKYKLWLDQKYISPYTGDTIQLSELFTTKYEIEHIIPQSRYFDDSLSNKVICEAEVNKHKDNKTAYEYIIKNEGREIELSNGKTAKLFTKEGYEAHVKRYFGSNKPKEKKLLSEDIPESFINRQLTDTRYISKKVKNLLSNIVREKDEIEATSKNIVVVSGAITAKMKQDWGLNDIWNQIIRPRFERLNEMTNSNIFGEWQNKKGKQVFQIHIPDEVARGFSKKRIDHRHHALDALVIACITRDHVSYLTSLQTEKEKYELVKKLRRMEEREGKKHPKGFHKPWTTFTQDVREALQTTIVSFKQNTRVINKTINFYQKWEKNEHGEIKKGLKRQGKGDNWAIRKPLHKETFYGKVNLRFQKDISLSKALENWQDLADKPLKIKVRSLMKLGYDHKKVLKYFKDRKYIFNDQDVSKVPIYFFNNSLAASRVTLDDTFNSKKIGTITDTGIQKILRTHLENYNTIKNGETEEHPELAFSPDGLDELNNNIIALNNGKNHQPIYKVRTYEPIGNKFNVGDEGNKKDKYVEAAKGTNLFFAVYQNEKGERTFETVPLNIVIERQKEGMEPVPETDEKENPLLFYLSPNDLVYMPSEEEISDPRSADFDNISKEQTNRTYKMVSSTGNECHFILGNVASLIKKYDSKSKIGEFGSLNKMETTIELNNHQRIKELCWKLHIDRLGQISKVIR